MKILLKIITVAAAFGMMPAAGALAQDANLAQPNQELAGPVAPGGAQPQEVSPSTLASGGEAPSDAEVAKTTIASRTAPTPGIGQPDGRMGVQEQVTPIGEEAAWFHNVILMPVITAISIFVLVLMLYVVVRYRRKAHPIPSRTTHNTLL